MKMLSAMTGESRSTVVADTTSTLTPALSRQGRGGRITLSLTNRDSHLLLLGLGGAVLFLSLLAGCQVQPLKKLMPPTPAERVVQMFNMDNADDRRQGINALSDHDWARASRTWRRTP